MRQLVGCAGAFYDRHRGGPDCNMPGATWTNGRCHVLASGP
ncbi:hypothetical protein PV342_34300 [Streptomyces sp. PA03-3a]|nr:hypothetical protein [Streptomyces sp. PA03-3a]